MNINFNGIGEMVATFLADDALTECGVAVKMSDSGTVTACKSGEDFIGICLSVRDGYASVQLKGYVTAKTTSTVTVGYQKLKAGTNKVETSTTGREYLVLMATTDEIGFIL